MGRNPWVVPKRRQEFTITRCSITQNSSVSTKSKILPRQAEVAQGVPGRLRPGIFLTFRYYKLNAPAAFTPGEIPGTHFPRLSRPQGTWFCRGYHGKKSPVTPPGIDPGTFQLVAQCLNQYATPGPLYRFHLRISRIFPVVIIDIRKMKTRT